MCAVHLEVEISALDSWMMYMTIDLAVFGKCMCSRDLKALSVGLDHTYRVKDGSSLVTGLAVQQNLSKSAQAFTPRHTSLAVHKRGIDHDFLIELFCDGTFLS